MTTLPETSQRPVAQRAQSSYVRIPAAFRLQFVVKHTFITSPLIVFSGAWMIAVGIGFWIHYSTGRAEAATLTADDAIYTGASQAALWALLFIAAYSASHTFPFSMALSYSRRVFVVGVFLAFAVVSTGFGVAFALAAVVERATDGYGILMYNFDLPFLTQGPGGIFSAALLATVLCLFLMMFGFFWSILYRRVSLTMLWVIILGVLAILLSIVAIFIQNGWWGELAQWATRQNALTLSGWLVLPAVGLTVVNYLVIRKATPTP